MNKNIISWTHYIYATITASVLAYVTVMDSSTESDDSATSMLPNIDNYTEEEEEEESLPEEEEEEEAEESLPEEEVEEEESLPIAEPVEPEQKPLFGSSRRKLKKNKTKTSKKISKNTKTHRRH
tara:strand:+ start:10331 stop:10702 length:372 start_codon:yes stop_codon:yes gene_type:complete